MDRTSFKVVLRGIFDKSEGVRGMSYVSGTIG